VILLIKQGEETGDGRLTSGRGREKSVGAWRNPSARLRER
jgi:hypothetical protein